MISSVKVPEKMTVPVFVGNGKIEYGERAVPVPGEGQLLLQVKANALCGSDRSQFFEGSAITPGHEASGIVVATGSGTKTAVGTPGVVFLMDFCGKCRSCLQGFTNQCLSKRADYGFTHHGGYDPYIVVNENVFFATDASIPLTEATMLLDIMGTGGHALKRAQLVHKDIQSVVVVGAGPIGLGVLAMVKILLGFHIPVVIMDFVQYRLDLAEKMGAIPVNLSHQTLKQVIEEAGYPAIDVAIDTSGKTAGRHAAMEVLAQRGALICVGHGQELNLKVSSDLIAPEHSVLGSEYFQYHEIEENHKLIQTHLSYLQLIITHRYGVDKIQEAYELFFKGDTGKVVIEQ